MGSRDTSNPETVGKEVAAEELRNLIEAQILEKVLDTFEGRHVLFRLLSETGVYHDFSLTDPELAKAIGRRSIGLELLTLVEQAKPGVYNLMRQEQATFDEQHPIVVEEEDDG